MKASTIERTLSLVGYINHVILFISMVATITAVLLAHVGEIAWAFGFMGLALVGVATLVMAAREEKRNAVCMNPGITIELDELSIRVADDHRMVEQRLTMSARYLYTRVTEYHFKLLWTGSSQDVEVREKSGLATLSKDFPPLNIAFRWQPYRLRFRTALSRTVHQTFELHYKVPDPGHQALPYHMISYAHVGNCKEAKYRLSFNSAVPPSKVDFVVFDERGIAQSRTKIEASGNAYAIAIKPRRSEKYALEWGTDESNEQ